MKRFLTAVLTAAVLAGSLPLMPQPAFAAISGTITALNGTVQFGLPQHTATVVVQTSGVFVATLVSEASIDGSSWFQLPMFTVLTGLKVDTVVAGGTWVISASGYRLFRVRASLYTSGTATVHLETSANGQASYVFTGLGVSVQDTNLLQIGGVAQSGANVVDTVNSAIKVNVVAGGAGGGAAQLQVRNSSDLAWVNVGVGAEGAAILKVPVRIHDASGNIVAILNAAPAGTEYALVVRNIPSGTQTVAGTVTANQGGTWTVTVTATDLDIRNLSHAQDSVRLGDGTDLSLVTAAGALVVDGSAVTQPVSGTVSSDTELEAAVALGDVMGNLTVPRVGAGLLAWDATNFFRLRGDTTNGLDVDVTRVQGTVTVAGTVTANQGTANTAANRWPIYLTDGTNNMPTMDAAARRGFVQITDGTTSNTFTGSSVNVNCTGGCGSPTTEATFYAYTPVSACAANKFQLVLFNNNATTIVKVRLVAIFSEQIAAVTGALPSAWMLRRRVSPTTDPAGAGTLTVVSMDTADVLAGSITAFNAPGTAPAGGTTQDFQSVVPQPDEIKNETTAMSAPTFQSMQNGQTVNGLVLFDATHFSGIKPIILRQDQTLELQQSATGGTCNFRILVVFSTV